MPRKVVARVISGYNEFHKVETMEKKRNIISLIYRQDWPSSFFDGES